MGKAVPGESAFLGARVVLSCLGAVRGAELAQMGNLSQEKQ